MSGTDTTLSIVIPARNEEHALRALLPELRQEFPDAEIVVVDDGSTDETHNVASDVADVVVTHPNSLGNGAAIKSGARKASGEWIAFMDGDGQHQPAELRKLWRARTVGFDMIVGARNRSGQATASRSLANWFYNRMASVVTGQRIEDLTSGLRLVKARKFKRFLDLLPNGFSYPTTITMCFIRSGFTVGYRPVEVQSRIGTSHIRPIRDGFRFLLIIVRIVALYSPLKIFAPLSLLHGLIGIGYYAYTYSVSGRFTNMSALLISASILIFLIGLISEQITALTYLGLGSDSSADESS